jgi:hypothetical protein
MASTWEETVMKPNDVNIMPYLEDFMTVVKAKDKEATEIVLGSMVLEIADKQAEITWHARDKEVEEAEQRGIKKVVEIGDALLNDTYWRGKFSVAEIKQFWNQIKERLGN